MNVWFGPKKTCGFFFVDSYFEELRNLSKRADNNFNWNNSFKQKYRKLYLNMKAIHEKLGQFLYNRMCIVQRLFISHYNGNQLFAIVLFHFLTLNYFSFTTQSFTPKTVESRKIRGGDTGPTSNFRKRCVYAGPYLGAKVIFSLTLIYGKLEQSRLELSRLYCSIFSVGLFLF